MKNSLLEIAARRLDLGYSVIPVNNRKESLVKWADFSTAQPELSDIKGVLDRAHGLAHVTGYRGLECLDFDNKDGRARSRLKAVWPFLRPFEDRICLEKSPSGGYHVWWMADNVEANRVLAVVGGYAANETRGAGGYAVAEPTPGYELLYGAWEVLSRAERIPELERYRIMAAAAMLGEYEPEPTPKRYATAQVVLPGKFYNELPGVRDSVISDLESAGWLLVEDRGDVARLCRPGKNSGVSATVDERGTFFCFSTNAGSFQSQKSYTPFAVRAVTRHASDYAEAARAIGEEYSLSPIVEAERESRRAAPPRVLRMMTAAEIQASDFREPEYVIEPFLRVGTTILAANPSSGKTILALALAHSLAGGHSALGFFPVQHSPAALIWLDDVNTGLLKVRLEKLNEMWGLPSDLFVLNEFPKLGQGCEEEIMRLRGQYGVRTFFIDTMDHIRTENRGRDVRAHDYQIHSLTELAAELEIAIVLIHHSSKRVTGGKDAGDPFDRIAGTRALIGATDNALLLTPETGLDKGELLTHATLYGRGRSIAAQNHTLAFFSPFLTWLHPNSQWYAEIKRNEWA